MSSQPYTVNETAIGLGTLSGTGVAESIVLTADEAAAAVPPQVAGTYAVRVGVTKLPGAVIPLGLSDSQLAKVQADTHTAIATITPT